jgi:hypothetical protein
MAVVYWLHLPEHTDIASQGYVGVSNTTAAKRFVKHSSDARRGSQYTVHKAIRKYRDKVAVDTIVEGDSDYCYTIERSLRPSSRIGWNCAVGGDIPSTRGMKHSDETKSRMSAIRQGKKLSPDTVSKMVSTRKASTSGRFKDWDNGRANVAVWRVAESLYETYLTIPACGHRRLAKAYGSFTFRQLTAITDKFKSGWIPSKDSDYMKWKATNG